MSNEDIVSLVAFMCTSAICDATSDEAGRGAATAKAIMVLKSNGIDPAIFMRDVGKMMVEHQDKR